MLGTVGLEVTNSINPELSWKPVTKGKRSRKSVARSLNGRVGPGSNNPKRVGDFSGSNSDKFVETGSGQCFPDKVEHVPIKKRRHFLRSPSPSSQPSLYGDDSVSPEQGTLSSHSDDFEILSDHHDSSGSYTNRRKSIEVPVGNGADDGVLGDKISEVSRGEHYNSDNFSGIALLAAAACIKNIGDEPYADKVDVVEVSSAPQRSDASTSSVLVRESRPCTGSGEQIQKDVSQLDNKGGCSFVMKGSVAVAHSLDENEEGMAAKFVSSKVDRRHWDLNTSMDAWEQPNDDATNQYNCLDTSTNAIVKLEKEGFPIQSDSRNNGNDAESSLLLNQIENVIECSASKVKENESEEIFCHNRSNNNETSLSNLKEHSMAPLNLCSVDTNSSRHVLSGNESSDNLTLSVSCHSSEVSGGNMGTKYNGVAISNREDTCINVMVCSTLNISEQNVALPETSDPEKFQCQSDCQLKDAEDSRKISELPDTRNAIREERCIGTYSNVEISEKSTLDNSHPSSKCEGLSTSDISVSQCAVICDAKDQDEKVLTSTTSGMDAVVCSVSNKLLFNHEDPRVSIGDADGRSVLQDTGKGFVLDDCHNMAELQVCYDSPYEDGELRGSGLCSWEENEFDDGEHECLDYESDGRGGEDSDADVYPGSKVVEGGSEPSQGTDKNGLLTIKVQETDSRMRGLKENMEKIEPEPVRNKVSNQGSGTTEELPIDVTVERNDGNMRRCHTSDHLDVLDVKGSYDGEVGSKTTKGVPKSRIKGSSSLDTMERRNTVYMHQSRSRNNDGTCSRLERDGSPERFVTRYRSAARGRERNEGDSQLLHWDSRNHFTSNHRGPEDHGPTRQRSAIGNSVEKFGGVNSHDQKQSINHPSRAERDSSPDRFATRYRSAVHVRERIGGDNQLVYWESRNRYPSSYRVPEGHWPTRHRCAIADSDDKFSGLNSHDQKQSISYSSKNMQKPLGLRRLPVDRDDYHGGQKRISGFCSNGNRGASRNFPEVGTRVYREEYHQPVNDDPSSVRMPQYMSWRDRNFFNPSTRGAHVSVPRRTSRSRSRTRSPHAWQSQREHNLGTRRHSRSPDFRSEAGIERTRVPFQKPSFAADYGESFVSPPRGRFSPQRNYRGTDDQNFVGNHLRHRRSPTNVFRQSQRLDSIGFSGRLNSDDSFRPMMRPGRFPTMAGVGRGCKLEDNNDDKRRDEYGESFMSPPRGHFSPQRNYRGVDDRNFVDNQLRHRRSPTNVFRQNQRLDSIGLSGRLNSDDSFRHMKRPGRFSSMASVGRGCKLEDTTDDKRCDD